MEVELTAPQEAFVFSPAQYAAFVGGFGSGKTFALITKALLHLREYPTVPLLWIAPTYVLIRDIAYQNFQAMLDGSGMQYDLNVSSAVLRVKGYAPILFRTAEKPERIIGFEVGRVFIDEFDTLETTKAMHVWRKAMGRARWRYAQPNGIDVGTTPEGFRATYQLFRKEQRPGFQLVQACTESNPNLPPGYVEQLTAQYPPNLIAAYLRGEFCNLQSGSVYPDFDRHANGTTAVQERGEPLHIGMDFNVQNMHAVVAVIRHDFPVVVGEIAGARDTPAIIRIIQERYAGHHVTVYPDASGKNRSSADASISDLALLRQAGFTVRAPRQNPRVRDRVIAVCNQIFSGTGERRLLINPARAPALVESLEQQAYDKAGEPDKASGHDHAADALGYFIAWNWPILRPEARAYNG